ncbi:hypothetical protein CAEBREN_02405 [Caenorhabditis brenneri]|uniref:Uncharacterized protein n=1 Tax=Caenorhabditis brenneri TaxID=135651 RepID=G0MCR9_CAEBE|nr:hypothetical protein CAEBREN_02405 [Caenorhabditis brenneri]
MKSYQLVLAPTNCATVPETRSEPPKQENVEKIFPTLDSVEQEKKSRKRSRHRSESSDTDVPPDTSKNLVNEREKQLRLQDRIKKVAENNRKIEEVSQSSMKKLDEKANLSTEVDRIHKEIAEKSEMCQKRKRDLQAKKDKNLERGREAKNRMEAELGKMKIGNELAEFNFNDTEDWLDVLKKVEEEIRECSSDEEAINRLEAELVGLQDILEKKEKMQNTVIQELKALDNQLANLYSELKAISEEGLECHGGRPHKKRSKRSEEDQGERVNTSEVQTKDASQPLTDAIDSGQAAAPDRIATFDSCASPTHWTLLDHDYTARADIKKVQNDSAHQNSSGSSTVISKTSKEMDEEPKISEKPGSQSRENAPEMIRMATGERAPQEFSKKVTIASKKSEAVKNVDGTMTNGNEKAKTSTIQEEVRKEAATSSPESSQGNRLSNNLSI